jgi:hypothetical protein
MPLNFTYESYDGDNALRANAGDWVDFETRFTARFSAGSGISNTITYNHVGNNVWLEFATGDWGDYGFLANDPIIVEFTLVGFPAGAPWNPVIINGVVDYVDDNLLYLQAPLIAPFPYNAEIQNYSVFPTNGSASGMLVIADKAMDAVEIQFNLTPNGSNTLNSVIDTELNRFMRTTPVGPTGVPVPMEQLTNKSGGYINNVEITLVATPTVGVRDYKVTGQIWQWGVIKDGFTEPNYYDQADCLAPVVKAIGYAEYGNPNGTIEDITSNTEANTGGYDENFNGGINNYVPISIEWKDLNGVIIDALDYSNECTFEAIISAPNQVTAVSQYRIGLEWRPIDGNAYKNNIYPIVNNLLVNAPMNDFVLDAAVDPTIYAGFPRIAPLGDPTDGAQWDITDVQFTISGVDEIKVTGKIIPNAAMFELMNLYPDGERLTTLWIQIQDQSLPVNISDRVNLKIFNDDNIDAPTIGVQIPNVINQFLYDHGGNDITDATTPNTTTEDDVLFTSQFRLIDNVPYQGIRTRFYAYNTVTEENFTLENNFFSFANVVEINGQFQPNFIQPRGFNLPPSSIRNEIDIIRDPSLDIPGQYGIQLNYGYLSRWEYWLEQANVNNDFFDITVDYFNGKNKNWQRFFSGDWILRFSYYTLVDGVEDFNHQDIKIRPYEDDPNVSYLPSFTVVSSGITPTDLVNNELIDILVVITWNQNYINPWGEMTCNDFEGGNRWVLSSIEPHDGVGANPLEPIVGATGLDITFPAPNVAEFRARIDTNKISSIQECLTYRIHSDEIPAYGYLVNQTDLWQLNLAMGRKLSADSVYPDTSPLIQVVRDWDLAVMDFAIDPLTNLIDPVAVLDWVTDSGLRPTANGTLRTWYDQSGNLNHAGQVALALQPAIVSSGVLEVDPQNGLIAGFNDGTKFMNLSSGIPQTNEFTYFFVFNRPIIFAYPIVGLATSFNTFPTPFLWSSIGGNMLERMSLLTNSHDILNNTTGNQMITTYRDNALNCVMRLDAVDLPTNPIASPNGGGTYQTLFNANSVISKGFFQEIDLANNDRSANFAIEEQNVKNAYGI